MGLDAKRGGENDAESRNGGRMQQSTDVQRMPIAIAMPMIAAAEERALEAEAALPAAGPTYKSSLRVESAPTSLPFE